MACDVTGASYSENFLDDSWSSKNIETTDLDAIAGFNAAFGGNEDSNTVNPQMLSNASSPAGCFQNPFNANGVDETLSPQPTNLDAYPANFVNTQASATPYYHPSLELQSAVPFQPSALRFQTRQRSISEPPDGFAQHRQMPDGPGITFHRGGHFLGDQHQQGPKPLKSLPKGKVLREQMRSQPYKCKPNRPDHHQPQQRYHMRRAQTQPMRPTMSVPAMPAPHPMAHMGMHGHGQQVFPPPPPMMEGQKYVTSRVCTPVPDAPPPTAVQSPQIDPLLMTTSPAVGVVAGDVGGKQTVTLPLTIEDLRAMIVEAVQQAVKGTESGNAEVVVGSIEEPTEGEVVEGAGFRETVEHDEGTAQTHCRV